MKSQDSPTLLGRGKSADRPAGVSPPNRIPPPEESEWRVGTLVYRRRGLARVFFWLLWGDFAWSVRDRMLGPVLGLLLKDFQATDKTIGLLTGTIPSAIGLILGPVVSLRSDRYRSRWGRRLPFLLAAAPAVAVAILGMGFAPQLGGLLHGMLGTRSPGLYPLIVLVLGLWWVAFDIAATAANTLFGALINDTVPHGVIGRFFGLFRAVSLAVAILFNFFLLGAAEKYYQLAFAIVAGVYGTAVVLMCLNVREGEYPPVPPAQGGSTSGRIVSATVGYFRECFSRPYYLWYFLATNLAALATLPVNLFSSAFVKSVGMNTADFGWYNAVGYVISLCLAPVLGILADRYHPLILSMIAIGLYGATLPWLGFYAVTPRLFGVALLVHVLFSGTFYTVSASLNQRLLPQNKFAQFSSAVGIVASVLNILLPVALGATLDHYRHEYRLTFFIGSGMSLVALGFLSVVCVYWRRYGGPHNYVPPE